MSQRPVDVSTLSLPELEKIKANLDDMMQNLTTSQSQLKEAAARYLQSKAALVSLNSASQGKVALIPITESLYVPAEIENPDRVIIDLGTGFYVEKATTKAAEYFDRKVERINKKVAELQQNINAKRSNVESIVMVMQQKIAQISSSAPKGSAFPIPIATQGM